MKTKFSVGQRVRIMDKSAGLLPLSETPFKIKDLGIIAYIKDYNFTELDIPVSYAIRSKHDQIFYFAEKDLRTMEIDIL